MIKEEEEDNILILGICCLQGLQNVTPYADYMLTRWELCLRHTCFIVNLSYLFYVLSE
jgi:hypothetical protein